MARLLSTVLSVLVPTVLAVACAGPRPDLPASRQGPDAASPSAARLAPWCPTHGESPPPAVTVAALNRVVAGLDLRYWQAGDIGASARLRDQRIVWVFGDTVRDRDVVPRMVSNSMLVTSGRCTSQVLVPGNGAVVPDRADGVAHWPMSVVSLPRVDGEVLVVTTARIRRGSGGGLDFTYLGSSAHLFVVRGDGVPALQESLDVTPDRTDLQQVNWGSAMTSDGTWLYVYGTRLPDVTAFGRELYVARAPVDDPRDRSRWQFWDGTRWATDPLDAAAVLSARGGVSQTVSVSHVDGHYVLVSKRDGDLGDTVYGWGAPTPVGPWTPRRGIRAEFRDSEGLLRYAPLAHPQITLADGRLLISISRNTTDFRRLLEQPALGRPVFAEIESP